MVEKPSVSMAKETLGVPDESGNAKYYATFGQYILNDEVFQLLAHQIEESELTESAKEIDLTCTLQHLASKKQLIACDIAGESYDVGIPAQYYDTFVRYHKTNNMR